MRFFNNTDNRNIEAKVYGVSNTKGAPDRGLEVTIRHNGDPELAETAHEIQKVVVEALNKHFSLFDSHAIAD
jgi:hypothetical protein